MILPQTDGFQVHSDTKDGCVTRIAIMLSILQTTNIISG